MKKGSVGADLTGMVKNPLKGFKSMLSKGFASNISSCDLLISLSEQ